MIVDVFSIYDVKLGEYLRPIFSQNEEVLKRELAYSMKQPTCPYLASPSDFVLHKLGQFDTKNGTFITDNVILYSLDNLLKE